MTERRSIGQEPAAESAGSSEATGNGRAPRELERWLAGLVGCSLVLGLASAVVVIAAVDSRPLVERDEALSPGTIAIARQLVANIDLRRLQAGDDLIAPLPVALLDAAINHWAVRSIGGSGAFDLADHGAEIRLSVPVSGALRAGYVNTRLTFIEVDARPRLSAVRVGSIPLPPVLAQALLSFAAQRSARADDWRLLADATRGVHFDARRGVVEVTWRRDRSWLEAWRPLAFTPSDIERLAVAQQALAGLLDHHSAGARLPLVSVLGPLLSRRGEPGARQGRAALLVLAVYLAGKDLGALDPEAANWPRPRKLRLTLLGRHDSAQHFAISAALAAWAGEPAAKAIGLYKEIEDARGPSGFSFADLAVDEAGARFGRLVAEGSPRFLETLDTLGDTQLVPVLDDLPEHLSAAEFARRFARGDNAAYRRLTAEIDRRIAALPLYR